MVDSILGDWARSRAGRRSCLERIGGTPLMELYVMYHAANEPADAGGASRSLVGNYVPP